MTDFCTIANPTGCVEKNRLFRITKTSAGGHGMIRPRGTLVKKEFTLSWKDMTSADKVTLEAFIQTNQGSSFTYTHHQSGGTYTVFLGDEEVAFTFVRSKYWSVSITLKEV
jgi:hypothetical protein